MSLVGLIQTQGHDVFKRLCSRLSPIDLWNLSNTCRSLQWMKHTCWNINAHLSRFVNDPVRFRYLMAKHDAIISGSNALQFFSLENWPDSDLDIYLPSENEHTSRSDEIDSVIEFMGLLVEADGYEFKLYNWQENVKRVLSEEQMGQSVDMREFIRREMTIIFDDSEFDEWPDSESKAKAQEIYNTKTIKTVFAFENKRTGKRVQIIPTKCKSPVMSIIKDYYSTLVLNFYTWNKAYCLFPYLTIRHRTGLLLRPMETKLRGVIMKYARRGYDYTTTLDPEMESARYINGLEVENGPHRRIGDNYTWRMKLDTTGIDTSDLNLIPDYVLEYGTYSVIYTSVSPGTEHPIEESGSSWALNCEPFISPILKYNFFYDANILYDPPDRRWVEEMGRRTNKYAKLAAWLFEDGRIQSYIRNGYLPWTITFPDPKPDGFRYRDEEVPKWYHLWEKQKGMVHMVHAKKHHGCININSF